MANSVRTNMFGPPEEIRKIFNKFDKNGDGKISCAELIDNLGELGNSLAKDDAQAMIESYDKNGDGQIDISEFVDFVDGGKDLYDGESKDEEQELKEAFDLYDMDRNGFISNSELYAVLERLGMKCSEDHCKKMIKQVDQNGDGRVDFKEFKNMMSNGFS